MLKHSLFRLHRAQAIVENLADNARDGRRLAERSVSPASRDRVRANDCEVVREPWNGNTGVRLRTADRSPVLLQLEVALAEETGVGAETVRANITARRVHDDVVVAVLSVYSDTRGVDGLERTIDELHVVPVQTVEPAEVERGALRTERWELEGQ